MPRHKSHNTKTTKPNTKKTTPIPTTARHKHVGATEKPQQKHQKPKQKLSNAERSAYFGRREAAKVLTTVLKGDANKKAVGTIKSLVYSPSVRNKKAAFALVCQTLKHLPIIKDVLDISDVLTNKWKRQQELIYVITYDLLFGKEIPTSGDAEKFLFLRKDALQSALAKVLVKKKVKRVEDLLAQYQTPETPKPRYVRVNTLKIDVESAVQEFGKHYKVQKDDLVPDLLILPAGVDLHDHPLVTNGSVFLQGKASSMVAVALGPQPGWEVLDACSAPGNKTVHLAALMRGKGRIVASELNPDRVKLLQNTISLAGATNVEVHPGDFLNINPKDPANSKLRAILLDPSCSGSGTGSQRLDHLLPSQMNNQAGEDIYRLSNLAAFQRKALEHALTFPSVERIVYSTCSIHRIENEDVVNSALPMAIKNGFQLATPFPSWPRRGLPVFEGSEHLLRMDPVEDKEGFFIALFVRKSKDQKERADNDETVQMPCKSTALKKRKHCFYMPYTRMSKMWLHTVLSSA